MTNETQWTPGPWHVEAERFTRGNRRGQTDFHVRATDRGSGVTYPVVTVHGDISDARLVAAAPDLYAALRAIADLARSTVRPSGQPALCRALLDIEGIARAVISKAEGR